jgi:hypothetical protein
MARDESAPEAPAEALPAARKSEPSSEDSPALPAAAAEVAVSSFESREVEVSSLPPEASAGRQNAPVLQSADLARSAAAPATPGASLEDCDALRRSIAALGSEEASDARYGLALCSLERFDHESTEESRTLAIEDAEAFLEGESEGSRAEEVREKLRRIKPD